MQTIEAILSLLFFLSGVSLLFPAIPAQKIDDSVYRIQLVEDSWRVLYLRGDFRDFGDSNRDKFEQELASFGNETGLCYFVDGIVFTNCRDGNEHEIVASLTKTVIYDGLPRKVTFSIGR
ncbi:hypothetical protein HZC07_04290 [Candidatus Micrarchaeota archaeon]|nr:hypothetical protein [Candidatus Micrarchaeota archaeon]